MKREDAVAMIISAITAVVDRDDAAQGVGEDSALFGHDALLDSLGLVSLIVELESAILETTGQSITLVDEAAFSRARSPFRTVGRLADYLCERVNSCE